MLFPSGPGSRCSLHLPQVPYEQLRLLLEERSAEAEVLRTRLQQREASLEINRKQHEQQVRCSFHHSVQHAYCAGDARPCMRHRLPLTTS